jgi:hypothetical protein
MFPRKVKSPFEHMAVSNSVRLVLIVALTLLFTNLIPNFVTAKSVHGIAQKRSNTGDKKAKQFVCGYDPLGATDELSTHHAHKFELGTRGNANQVIQTRTKGALSDDPDIAPLEDDGTMVIQPTRFNLKNSSIVFTPEGSGYRISAGDVAFSKDFGDRLGFFFGADNTLGDADNGYRDIRLLDAPFTFFGISYDTIYVGTNGYITFTQGDTTARLSPTALAATLPRIAPLWADLELITSGDLHYNRLEGRHLITWEGAAQPAYEGNSTFQAVLYDDGRIAFVYRKVKAQAAMIGISPGGEIADPLAVDFSNPPSETVNGTFFQVFGKQKRLDLPAVMQSFYGAHSDLFDTAFIWTDFPYDNGLGIAHSFNVRNHISGIGLRDFDRGQAYGSPSRLSTIITMGNVNDWPSDPQAHAAGLNSAVSIVCHEQGHRWLAYVRFDAGHQTRSDLLGRENAHWSFLVDSRTNSQGSFSSLMEGNAWASSGGGTFTTTESAVNYFNPLDQYLMGLRSPDQVGDISYLVTDSQLTEYLREKSPFAGFSMTAVRTTISLSQIISHEGERIPDSEKSPKEVRIGFILLTEQGKQPSPSTLDKIARYRDALVRYFSQSTEGRASMNASLAE